MKSKEKKENKHSEENQEEVLKDQENSSKAEIDYSEKIRDLEFKVYELENAKISLLAEIENTRKSHSREKIDLLKYSNQKIILNLIPLIDNYEKALKISSSLDDKNVKKFFTGILMSIEEFKNYLKSEGVEEYSIEEKKDIWNSEFCEIIDEIENDEYKEGTIIDVLRSGYSLNGRMIRPASVVVSKKVNKKEPK